MKLISPVNNGFPEIRLNHKNTFGFFGSCFAENIGEQFKTHQFLSYINPIGIAFNPISLIKLITRETVFSEEEFDPKSLFHYDIHSQFIGKDLKETVSNANQALAQKEEAIKKSNFLFITWGTAWAYELKSSGALVNNCHKQKADLFSKCLLDVNEIVEAWKIGIRSLKEKNPSLEIVFTVSPVRHLKDGFHENQLSKSTLHLALHQLIANQDDLHYFPSYEIVMDEMRDYRFYKEDLIHLNKIGIRYIWEIVFDKIISEKSQKIIEQVAQIKSGIAHKAFHPDSKEHLAFIKG